MDFDLSAFLASPNLGDGDFDLAEIEARAAEAEAENAEILEDPELSLSADD